MRVYASHGEAATEDRIGRDGYRDARPRGVLPARRRRRLEEEIDGSPILQARRLLDDGLEAWQVVQERGYEGLVAKDEMAPYRPSTRWWKVKVRHEGRFLVGGMVQTEGGYVGLVLGRRVGCELQYVGTVEWGVGRAVVDTLTERARARAESPFVDPRRWRGARWLEPHIAAEVTYAGSWVGGCGRRVCTLYHHRPSVTR